jgi:membrane fusion protein (multidrug efflux system)
MKGKRTIILIVIFIAVLLLVKFLFIPAPQKGKAAASVQVPTIPVAGIVLKPSSITEQIYATGSVMANEEVELHPEVSGKLMQINFKEGSIVKKGDLLIKINDADLQAQIHKVALDKKLAEDRVKRNEKLLQMKGISQEEYEALQNSVASLEADEDLLAAQIAKTEIRAPFNGTIGLKTVSEGSYVTPQTLIASLQQIDPVKIDFSIPEKYASMVKKDDEIVFTVGSSVKQFAGKIYAVEPKVDNVTRTVQIRALCPNSKAEVIPGAFARITLKLREQSNALMIPTQSIVPILKGKQVFVYRDGKAEAVKIETGMRNDTTVQVTNGLNENDTVLTTGIISLRPGTDVKLTTVY